MQIRRRIHRLVDYFSPIDKAAELPRNVKQTLMLLVDLLCIPLAIWISVALRWGSTEFPIGPMAYLAVGLTIAISAALFLRLGLYRAVIRFMGHQAIMAVLKAVTVSALVFSVLNYTMDTSLPRSTPLLYWAICVLLIGGSRLGIRAFYQYKLKSMADKVVIYGAGASGRQLLTALLHSDEYHPVCFIDDDPRLQGTVINGVTVAGPERLAQLVNHHEVSQVLLAMPSVAREYRRDVINRLVGLAVHVKTIPNFASLIQGRASIAEIQDIDIEDLLGRDPVPPHPELIDQCVESKVVLVTGAGGSIGAELCRQIINHKPKELVLFEASEFALYQIEQELRQSLMALKVPCKLTPLLGSVKDKKLIQRVMNVCEVQTVYHAAAHKHVPVVEYNVAEGVANNVFGTVNTALAAVNAHVERFVLVSTDKAVRPTNIMGASKRLAEIVLQGLAQKPGNTNFSMVRFGNVLGSSGSVVPLFRDQINSGGPVTVTHTEIIRYFMTIPEAAQLVLQSGALARGGDVFVLDMGEPVRIVDLARRMIRLMGFEIKDENNPYGDIEIKVTGLRPGEKLYEELLVGNNVSGTGHPMIMCAEEEFPDYDVVQQYLISLEAACSEGDCDSIRAILVELVNGFVSKGPVADYLWERMAPTQSGKTISPRVDESPKVKPLFPEKTNTRSS